MRVRPSRPGRSRPSRVRMPGRSSSMLTCPPRRPRPSLCWARRIASRSFATRGGDRMAVLLLTSASGAPGVTTLGVGLALCWPRSVLLADCDPGAHQAVLAGYLAGTSAEGKGLLRVAEAHRDRRPLTELVIDQSVPLTEDDTTMRLLLPDFPRPSSAGLFDFAWLELAEAFVSLDDHGFDVIVDAGRLSHSGLPTALVERADLTALVLRSDLRSIVSARVHLLALREHPRLQASARSLGLILVGAGQPYSAR